MCWVPEIILSLKNQFQSVDAVGFHLCNLFENDRILAMDHLCVHVCGLSHTRPGEKQAAEQNRGELSST